MQNTFKKNGNNECSNENGQGLQNYPNSMKYR